MSSSLPTPGGSANTWGTQLNDYLQQSLGPDGKLVTDATNPYTSSANTNLASGSQPGLVQLAGDLGNTAASPQVTSTHLSSPLPPAQGGTGVANSKNLTVSNSLTLAGTDSTTMNFPTTTATIARTDAAQTFTGKQTGTIFIETPETVSVSSNAGTCSVSYEISNFTNSSAANMTITLATSSAVDGQKKIVRVYDFSAVAKTISWVNNEDSSVTTPTTSNGSTTLPITVAFMYNSATSKWRCVGFA